MSGNTVSDRNVSETTRTFSEDSDVNLFGMTANPEESLDELYSLVEQCEPDCNTCRKFIHQLSNHIRGCHSRSPGPDDIENPSNVDTVEARSESQEKYVQVTPNLNLVKTENINYSEMEDVSEYDFQNIPTTVPQSSTIAPSIVTVTPEDYSSIIVDTIKSESYDNEEISIDDDPLCSMTQNEGHYSGRLCSDASAIQTPYKCKICKVGYSTQLQLNIHSRTHANKETPFWCVHCKKGYNIKHYFDRHMKIHTGENADKPFECDVCGKRFRIRDSLKAHKVKHKVGEKHKCEECGKCFCQPGLLAAHKRTHTGERPFICDICQKSFHRKPTLARHMWTHTEEKPYTCQTCGSGFIRREFYIDHIKEHNGEKPYVCNLCRTRFNHKRNLVKHEQTCIKRHGGETITAELTENGITTFTVHLEKYV